MTRVETGTQVFAIASLSLLLAVLIWLSVALERRAEASLSVPVVIERLPAGLVVRTPPPDRLVLKVSGPRLQLYKLKWARPVCRLDLSAAAAGTVTFDSPESLVDLNRELKVVRVSPAAITLTLAGVPQR